jgi:excinuclease ABC subunit B
LDNRPLKFDEFEALVGQTIYMSATPADYELEQSGGVVVEQVVRPTGLLDPPIEVRPATNQVDDLLNEIEDTVDKGERVLVTTLTKCMAEELNTYLINIGIRACYIHSDVETLDRVEILQNLRAGAIDVLVGVNLLREGLDLPEVSLVAIMDADKEGFLRNVRSLTQTAGRAARHVNGRVIFYANKMTKSMQATIDETNRRRSKQIAYNELHHIVPKGVVKSEDMLLTGMSGDSGKQNKKGVQYVQKEKKQSVAAEDLTMYNVEQLEKKKKVYRKEMEKAVKELDFEKAAEFRDAIVAIENRIREY